MQVTSSLLDAPGPRRMRPAGPGRDDPGRDRTGCARMTLSLGLLPAVAIAGAIAVILLRRPDRGLREAVLEAVVIAAVWLVVGSELLSWGGALGPGALHVWWAIPV